MKHSSFISNSKRWSSRIIIGILCIFIIIGILNPMLYAMKPQKFDFYDVEPNTIDVLCIGSSHVDCSINPVVMWDEYGIAAYDMAGGSQSIWYSYYYLLEALNTQQPQIVVLDVYSAKNDDDSYYIEKAAMNFQKLNTSINKLRGLMSSENEDMWSIMFDFTKKHALYEDLNYSSFHKVGTDSFLGYNYQSRIEVQEDVMDIRSIFGTVPITAKAEEYLIKFIELCKKEQIDLIIVNSPWSKINEESQQKYNYIQNIADSNSVPFINGCLLHEELNYDWEQDSMGDGGHLNYNGSLKWSRYLAEYISTNYGVFDRRGNNAYKLWDQESLRFKQRIWTGEIGLYTDINDYIAYVVANPNNVTVIAIDNCYAVIPESVIFLLESNGIDLAEDGAVVCLNDGSRYYYTENGDQYHTDLGPSVLKVEIADNKTFIELNRKVVNKTDKGITIVTFDPTNNKIVESVSFDAENDWGILR